MRNYVQPGEHLTLTMPAAVTSGAGVLIGAIFGVAQGNCPANEQVVLVRRGVFDLPKLAAQAWVPGAKVYWNDTDKVCTTVATGNTAIGAVAEPAANPSAIGRVLLDGMIR
jgi:predicted RecA/RadA family phage recombinase